MKNQLLMKNNQVTAAKAELDQKTQNLQEINKYDNNELNLQKT